MGCFRASMLPPRGLTVLAPCHACPFSLYSSLKYVPTAVLSRQTAGLRGRSLIINLPGKPKSIRETFDEVSAGLHVERANAAVWSVFG